MSKSVEVSHLHVSYYGNEVVKDVSFSFDSGNIIGIIGPNGAGKSTLMQATLGLIPKDKGEVSFQGESIKEVRKKIAYVPQRNNIDWDFPILVRDTVLLGTYPGLKIFRRPGKAEKELALACLKQVGMVEFSNRIIGEISGVPNQQVYLTLSLTQLSTY